MRRGKALPPCVRESRPTTGASVGSNRSGSWSQRHELKYSYAEGPHWQPYDHADRNASGRRAGPKRPVRVPTLREQEEGCHRTGNGEARSSGEAGQCSRSEGASVQEKHGKEERTIGVGGTPTDTLSRCPVAAPGGPASGSRGPTVQSRSRTRPRSRRWGRAWTIEGRSRKFCPDGKKRTDITNSVFGRKTGQLN